MNLFLSKVRLLNFVAKERLFFNCIMKKYVNAENYT